MSKSAATSYPKDKINILLLENISDTAVEEIKSAGYANVRKLSGALSESELIKELKDEHILGIRSKTQVTEKAIKSARKLLSIGCYCIGVNQVDLQSATKYGVAVFNSPYSNTRSVAELVIGASVMLMRRVSDKNMAAHKGIWMKDAKSSYELRGKTIGIIGYGNIGSQVSVLAEAMGMKVIYFDVDAKLPVGNAIAARTIEEVLRKSNIVTLHVPSTPQTQNMIGEKALSQMKKGALFINYSRGDVVDIDALAKAIKSNHIGGAAIDVYPEEPEKNGAAFHTPLQNLPNVLLTPHIGGSTEEAQHNIGLDVTGKLMRYLELGSSTGSHSIPALNLNPLARTHRILHIHENVPGVLSEINTKLSQTGINILAQYLKTNDSVGYVVLDVETGLSKSAFELLKQVKGTIRARMLY